MPVRPNIVLCTFDQLRAFEIGCYGNHAVHTPNIDRLARSGVRFETAVTNYPVCMAARSVLLSGQHNRTCTGGVANVAHPGLPGRVDMPEYPERGRPHLPQSTLAEELRNAGYRTSVIGKWHIHSWPDDVGFDQYVIPRVHHCHSGQSFTENGGPEFVPDGFSVDYEASRVEAHLRERRDDRPFFLFYNISPPHCPLADAPESFRAMFGRDDVVLRPNVDPRRRLDNEAYWFRVYRYDFRHYNLHLPYADRVPDGYDLRALIAEYWGLTAWADAALGRMLDALDATGLSEETIVLFTSDHGDNLGSHGLVQKGGPTEESIRIPWIVRTPRLTEPGVISGTVASLVDVAPTLLGLVGLGVPPHMQGRDLGPVLRREPTHMSEHAIIETGGGAAVRSLDRMCFVPYVQGTRRLGDRAAMAYDMEADPCQMRNVAADATSDRRCAELISALRDWDRATPWMSTAA